MGREVTIGSGVEARYAAERIVSPERESYGGALQADIGGHHVELVDEHPIMPRQPFSGADPRVPGMVQVLVDGRASAKPVPATVRLTQRDANRYWGFVHLQRLVDRDGPERLVVAQRLAGNRYKTVSVFPDGQVVEDEFGYADRCSPPVRALLIRSVVPHPSGYCSDVLQVWPSMLYPVLYPWATGSAGALLLVLAGLVGVRRHGRPGDGGLATDA
jgi:hypothetical protein